MISSSFFSVLLCTSDQEPLEISVLDLCADGFTFRMTPSDSLRLKQPSRVVCRHRGLKIREELTVSDFALTVEETNRYFILYRLISSDPAMIPFMRSVMSDLSAYAELKNGSSDAALSAFYSSYPAGLEKDFPADFISWRAGLLASAVPDPGWEAVASNLPPLHLAVSFPETREQFFSLPFPEFVTGLMTAAGLGHHPLTRILPAGVCFGFTGCPELFPSAGELVRLIRRCEKQSLEYSVVFPPVPEDRFDSFAEILNLLASPDLPKPERIILNDWGMVCLTASRYPDVFHAVAGVLLARAGKDPRSEYRLTRTKPQQLSSVNSISFRSLLKENRINGAVRETVQAPVELYPGDLLTFPFYQLATATRCTLRSVFHCGSRGCQPEDDRCDRECGSACFGYGSAVNMIGRGNSLFAADLRFLCNAAYASSVLVPGPEMLILDLLS